MKGLILSLGAPNDKAGNLSPMATERLNAVINLYRHNNDMLIACTGGIGKHFNETEHPHYYYSHIYLQKNGIPDSSLTAPVYSTNTIEDFTQARELIYHIAPPVLIVVSSDFHMERVKIIHEKMLGYPATIFWGTPAGVPDNILQQLKEHEKNAIDRLSLNRHPLR
jgi:uncharacterized SAM-binding protein YcdF (DUF218 family)